MVRSIRFLVAVALGGGLPSSWAATAAPIRSVVLYPGTAVVQREIQVAAGTPSVEIADLPTGFSAESLHLSPSEGIHTGQVQVSDSATIDSNSPREAAIEARIQDLKDQETALDVDIGAANQVTGFLSRIGTGGDPAKAATALDARTLSGLLETMRRGMTDALTTVHRSGLQKRDLEKQVAADERDLAGLQGSPHAVRTVRFAVSAERAGHIVLSYPMGDSGWTPTYRALLDSTTGKVSLERQALIYQQTGEDWSQVALRLSTGAPDENATPPDANAWYVSLIQPMPLSPVKMAAPAAPAAMMRSADMAKAAPSPPAAASVSEPLQTAFATVFDVGTPVSLSADGSKLTVTLETAVLAAHPRIRTVPRLEAAAYVEAEAERPEGVWLPGEVQLVRDGDFVGTLDWQPERSDKFLLSFGRDDRVHVKYTRNKTSNGTGSFIDSRLHREVTDTFTVTSTHATALPLLVLEPSPVSTADAVQVEKHFTPTPQHENWDDAEGVVAWETMLVPKATQTFETRYMVTYPKDKQVEGLP